MHRDLLENLNDWMVDERRKPLIMRGARQVGKSWLAREIGKKFDNMVEINFETDDEIAEFFKEDLRPGPLVKNISDFLKKKITPGKTLLFLDEIQNSPRAITALRYFYEDMPELHVIAAGSLLEFELRNISIPVGRVSFLYVYPLSFSEFLSASGNEILRNMIMENGIKPLLGPFHKQLLKEIRDFSFVGGLPSVVETFIATGDYQKCIDVQSDLLLTYKKDFHKYAKESQIKYLDHTFSSIPHQLGKKFKYSAVSRDIKARVLNEALDLLVMAGVAYKVYHSSSNGMPLKAEVNFNKFKVLFFDIGLAQRMLKLDYRALLLNPDISQINDGAIAELFVGNELLSYTNPREESELFYWHREAQSSNAEIDFVTEINGIILPIEVKSGTTGRMRSLQMFMKSKASKVGLKISGYPYSLHNNIISVPFYGIEAIKTLEFTSNSQD